MAVGKAIDSARAVDGSVRWKRRISQAALAKKGVGVRKAVVILICRGGSVASHAFQIDRSHCSCIGWIWFCG